MYEDEGTFYSSPHPQTYFLTGAGTAPTCCVSREVVGFHCDSRVLFMTTALVEAQTQSDAGSQSDSLFPFRDFSGNCSGMLVFSIQEREKSENSLLGKFSHLLPTLFIHKKAFGLRVHLVEFQAFRCQHGHLDNYAPLHFVLEESQSLSASTPHTSFSKSCLCLAGI